MQGWRDGGRYMCVRSREDHEVSRILEADLGGKRLLARVSCSARVIVSRVRGKMCSQSGTDQPRMVW
jgi:hypothetical protein